MSPIFLDFEASSLHRGSFPIEIGWVLASGDGESHLIRPAPEWLLPTPTSNWSPNSERIHGIALASLLAGGMDHWVVATKAAKVFDEPGAMLVADSGFDGMWLNRLMRAADVPTSFSVIPVDEAYAHACRPLLRLLPSSGSPERSAGEVRVADLASSIIARCEEDEERRVGVRHRALADAASLWRTWRAIGAEAESASRGRVG